MAEPFNPFARLIVTFNPEGGTKVVWVMNERFRDPLPHTYTLQVSLSSTPTADDYEDVGLPVSNAFFAVDDERRIVSKSMDVHYRVKLVTPNGTYYSPTASGLTYLNKREWLHARDQIRQTKKMIRKYTGCYEGFLLKRKRFGVACTRCLDPVSQEVRDSKCSICRGTRYVAGYFAMVPLDMELGQEQTSERLEEQAGMTKTLAIQAKCAADIILNTGDVFVSKRSGRRWFIEISQTVEYRGYPTKYELTIRLLPFSDIVYSIPIEGS